MSADPVVRQEKPAEKPSITELKAAIADCLSKALHAYAETRPDPDN
jgi:hypothetical protein